MTTRYTDPRRVAAFLRCTLYPAGITLRDEGGRLVIEQPEWRHLQDEVDLRQAAIRAVLAEWAQDGNTGATAFPFGSDAGTSGANSL